MTLIELYIIIILCTGSSKKNSKSAAAKAALSKILNVNQTPGLKHLQSTVTLPFGGMTVAQELTDYIGT